MRPAARLQAIADLLATMHTSRQPLDRMVQSWGRQNRYAGSKDRRDISNRLFAIARHYGALRARLDHDAPLLMAILATHVLDGEALDDVLALADGSRHAPAVLSKNDEANLRHAAHNGAHASMARADRLSVPDWLLPEIDAQLGEGSTAALQKMGERAPVDVRVNLLKGNRAAAQSALADEGIEASPHPLVETALRLTGTPRFVDGAAYQNGLIEVQDAGAQAVAAMCAAKPFDTVMDFCAGAGGKALALAAHMQNKGRMLAHDAIETRMRDLPERAKRAGVSIIEPVATKNLPDFASECDLVVADVPCSGAGRWRRAPETKWRLTRAELDVLVALQSDILCQAAALVKPGGRLVYMTCSILACENARQVSDFLHKNQSFKLSDTELPLGIKGGIKGQTQWHPALGDSDGMYCAVMQRV